MSYMKQSMMECQEFIWDYFDEDGAFIADKSIKDKDDLISVVENNWGSMGVEIAKEEIFTIETGEDIDLSGEKI